MAGKDSEGMSPVDESVQHVEESPDINRNPESREKDKPLKKKAEEGKSFSAQLFQDNIGGEERLHWKH